MIVVGNDHRYNLGPLVAQDERFDVHTCSTIEDSPKDLLIVAATDGHNPAVDRWSFTLGLLARHARRVEEEYAKVRTDPNVLLNYQLGFPRLVETFMSPKKRRIMILAFENSEPSAMVPIARMVRKDRLRVDLKTSVWMMGKLLKILAFAHQQGISVGSLGSGTVLIDPKEHYVNVFDWSNARIAPKLDNDATRSEIVSAALAIVEALGGDADERFIPNNEGEEGERLIAHLWTLCDGLFCDANVAHGRFYQLVEKLWGRKFYPFTTHPIEGV